jgi:Protein of unknown function (DUF3551)
VRLALFILAAFAAAICITKSAEALNGAWCAYYDLGKDGFRSCRFTTLQQCLNDVRGIGGNCSPSPYPSPPPSTRHWKTHRHINWPRRAKYTRQLGTVCHLRPHFLPHD